MQLFKFSQFRMVPYSLMHLLALKPSISNQNPIQTILQAPVVLFTFKKTEHYRPNFFRISVFD